MIPKQDLPRLRMIQGRAPGNTLTFHKGKPCRGHHPCPSSHFLGKDSPLSKEVTCAADPKIIMRKGKDKANWKRCYLVFRKGRILLWLCCTSFRYVTPFHFPIFIWSISRAISVGHEWSVMFLQQDHKASLKTLLKYKHYIGTMTK